MAPRQYTLGRRAAEIEETRRRIVEATVALHAEKGVVATSMQDIARRADVAVGTVHRHFPSLDQVVTACGARVRAIMRLPMAEIFANTPSLPGRVRVLVGELFAFYERGAPWIRVALCERAKVPRLEQSARALEGGIEALVREALRPVAPPQRVVWAVLAMASFSVWQSLASRGLSVPEATELVSSALLAWLEPAGGRWHETICKGRQRKGGRQA